MPLHIRGGINFFWVHVFPKGFKEMSMDSCWPLQFSLEFYLIEKWSGATVKSKTDDITMAKEC